MEFLELSLESPEANLAADEALLQAAEAGECGEILRIWESQSYAVVVGRASQVAVEVDVSTCAECRIPILRRCSGGCAVVIGPGCLSYALVLELRRSPGWREVRRLHFDVLTVIAGALSVPPYHLVPAGTSDLCLAMAAHLGDGPEDSSRLLKVSGNSVRYGKNFALYHGTLLYGFDLSWISRLLRHPPRQPDYRRDRPHAAFVTNLPLSRDEIVTRLRQAWSAFQPALAWPRERTQALLAGRYSRQSWHFER